MLDVGAVCIRTETELIIKSRYVVPEDYRRWDSNFNFQNCKARLQIICR
jgi:hypothetical protein